MTAGGWLLKEGVVLATTDVADNPAARMRGLLGRSSFEGALLLPHTRAVHTLGMRFALDVAFLDRDLKVLDVAYLPPWRMSLPRRGGRSILEAQAGAFERWGLGVGDRLELRQGS
jgi:uncharacterized protein